MSNTKGKDMLKELVETLLKTGQDTVRSSIAPHPTDPDKRLVIGPAGVSVLETPRMNPGFSNFLYTVDDFAKCVKKLDDALEDTIWYDEHRAIVYSIDPFRKYTVEIEFPHHPFLNSVLELKTLKWFDQRSLLRFLRINLSGCIEDVVTGRFRSLNWESARRTKQVILHGKSSLDSDVQASVKAGDAEAPELFAVEFPLFAINGWKHLTHRALIAVDLDVEQCKIGLCLMPGSEELIVESLRGLIYNALDDAFADDSFTIVGGTSQHNDA